MWNWSPLRHSRFAIGQRAFCNPTDIILDWLDWPQIRPERREEVNKENLSFVSGIEPRFLNS
jgi:hypothetical protein